MECLSAVHPMENLMVEFGVIRAPVIQLSSPPWVTECRAMKTNAKTTAEIPKG